MNVKQLRARVQHKHKTEAEWYLDVYVSAGSTELRGDPFIPLSGELIVFDKDVTYDYDRIKFGDGETNVMELPFASAGYTLEKDGSNILLKKNGVVISTITDADTDTKVTSEENHYTPSETAIELSVEATGATEKATWDTTNLVTGVNLQRDGKGHIVGITVDSIKMPENPNTNDGNDNQTVKADNVTFDANDVVEFVAGSNVTIEANETNATITIKAEDTTYSDVEANGDSGLMTGADKAKLDGIENGANKTIVDEALNKDSSNPVQNKVIKAALDNKLETSLKGTANGLAELDANGKVLSAQLPSYVDDVLEYANKDSFPEQGESGKIYVDLNDNLTYRWSGTTYIEISRSLALGEIDSTAYRGDRGKIAYDHSQSPHAPADAEKNVQSDWNETNTTSDAYIKNKPTIPTKSSWNYDDTYVKYSAAQTLSDTQKSTARANIGAGTSSFSGDYDDLSNKPTIPTVNNAILTIQKNGTAVNTFTANSATDVIANITVPTKTSELQNDSGFKTTDNNTTYDLVLGTEGVEAGKLILVGSDSSRDIVELPGDISQGEAEDTLTSGTNAQAISQGSIALGVDVIAGSKAFYIEAIDKTNKKIYLRTTGTIPTSKPTQGAGTTITGFTTGYEVGDEFSIINGTHYAFCGTITAVNGNVITYSLTVKNGSNSYNTSDKFETIASVNSADYWKEYIFWVPSKPQCGFIIESSTGEQYFQGSQALGINNNASASAAFVTGTNNIGGGKGASILGTRNKGAYGNLIAGGDNLSTGLHSMILGRNNLNMGDYNLITNRQNIIYSGDYNVAGGYATRITGGNNATFGNTNITVGHKNLVSGEKNTVTGNGNIVHTQGPTTVTGNANAVFGEAHIVTPKDSNSTCKYNLVGGNKHEVQGNFNVLGGYKNKSNGDTNIILGYECDSQTSSRTILLGRNLKALWNEQIIVGRYNKQSSSDIFIIGDGTSSTPKNIFTVPFGGEPSKDTDAITKGYLDVHAVTINSKNNAIVGTNCKATHSNCFLWGEKLVTTGDNQFLVGKFNNTTLKDVVFGVGCGKSDSSQSTPFRVETDGMTRCTKLTCSGKINSTTLDVSGTISCTSLTISGKPTKGTDAINYGYLQEALLNGEW